MVCLSGQLTRGLIFSPKVIFIPVNLDGHWSLTADFSPLMGWLNHEWSKKTNAQLSCNIFDDQSIRLFKPQGKSIYGF
jgi:hypothetical protein